jgi:hypothetical protein
MFCLQWMSEWVQHSDNFGFRYLLTNNTGPKCKETGENIQSFETSALLSFFLLSFGNFKYKSTSKIQTLKPLLLCVKNPRNSTKFKNSELIIIKEPRKSSTFPHWAFAKSISLLHYSGKNTVPKTLWLMKSPLKVWLSFTVCVRKDFTFVLKLNKPCSSWRQLCVSHWDLKRGGDLQIVTLKSFKNK